MKQKKMGFLKLYSAEAWKVRRAESTHKEKLSDKDNWN